MMRVGILVGLVFALSAHAQVQWESVATHTTISAELHRPTTTPSATIFYLTNLSIPRLGTESDNAIINDLLGEGDLVIVLDYVHHPNAISPDLNADVLKLREDLAAKNRTLLASEKIDLSHVYILAEGFRLNRDIEFARDGDRTLAMDIAYPSKPATPVSMLMEITCDNQNRMGNSSLVFCHDTLLEGAQFAGFAWAMVDHPVAPPYKGLDDPMSQCIDRMRRAVRILRAFGAAAQCGPKLGAIGFSRGGPFAAILAVMSERNDDAAIQAALIHGNRYDYLDLLPSDPMLPRFAKAWGERETNQDKWAEHGAAHYLGKSAAPMFLNTSDKESPEYRDGLAKFDKLLTVRGIEHEYQVDADGRGHRVSTDPKTLAAIYRFFHKHLDRN